MRTLEIKKIAPGPVFRFLFVAGSLGGFFVGIGWIILGISLHNIWLQIENRPVDDDPLQIMTLLTGVFLGSPVAGICLGLGGMLGAWIYNGLASMVGGIILKVNDR